MASDALQGLYLTSRYAQWLTGAPFGFDRASGNFTRGDGDAINLNVIDGAGVDGGLPDFEHLNNANFDTPPDGRAPTMQMYLYAAPYLAGSAAQDLHTIAHELTHGLSNRLVVNSDNHSTLTSYQARAMGEGWSDFYAFDYLLSRGLETNTPAPGELMYERYLARNKVRGRTEAIDCGIDEAAPRCVQLATDAGPGADGGYTYDDVGDGLLGTEVHSAGEAWGQTLFDVWEDLGHAVTMAIVTEGMRLSPDDPSMVDMRDAIMAADQAIYGGDHVDRLWTLFAARGFGYYAGSADGADEAPGADFHTPPPAGTPTGSVAGTVTDDTGQPIEGALVEISGPNDYSARTDANGHYRIDDVVIGTWQKITASSLGYVAQSASVTVESDQTTTFDASLGSGAG